MLLACGLGRPSGGPQPRVTFCTSTRPSGPLIDWEEVHYCRHGRQHWGRTGNGECSCKLTIMLWASLPSQDTRELSEAFPLDNPFALNRDPRKWLRTQKSARVNGRCMRYGEWFNLQDLLDTSMNRDRTAGAALGTPSPPSMAGSKQACCWCSTRAGPTSGLPTARVARLRQR